MWCAEQYVMDETGNAFSDPYVRQVINKCIEETPEQDQTNELWYVPGPKFCVSESKLRGCAYKRAGMMGMEDGAFPGVWLKGLGVRNASLERRTS